MFSAQLYGSILWSLEINSLADVWQGKGDYQHYGNDVLAIGVLAHSY